eukprot:5981912-Ditylum_brightwellii.AAC.1
MNQGQANRAHGSIRKTFSYTVVFDSIMCPWVMYKSTCCTAFKEKDTQLGPVPTWYLGQKQHIFKHTHMVYSIHVNNSNFTRGNYTIT